MRKFQKLQFHIYRSVQWLPKGFFFVQYNLKNDRIENFHFEMNCNVNGNVELNSIKINVCSLACFSNAHTCSMHFLSFFSRPLAPANNLMQLEIQIYDGNSEIILVTRYPKCWVIRNSSKRLNSFDIHSCAYHV